MALPITIFSDMWALRKSVLNQGEGCESSSAGANISKLRLTGRQRLIYFQVRR